MNLPDFLIDGGFIDLRRRMGAERLGDLTLRRSQDVLTVEELERLSGSGIDVDVDQVRVLVDGTLAYKDSRVILYIRDRSIYGNHSDDERMPKFHVANCKTLVEMKSRGRAQRYVVATRTDGLFQVNLIKSGRPTVSKDERLAVCQNCLSALQFEGFSADDTRQSRYALVAAFTIEKFFMAYPKAFVSGHGHDTDLTAPLDDYPPGFSEYARRLKTEAGYRCSACGRGFAAQSARKYLHVHHINGVKYDSNLRNLRVLCFGCHMRQPDHGHMKTHPDYAEFTRMFG